MALIWIITFVLFISNFGRFTDGNAQDHIVFPSAKLWDQKSDPFSSLSLPVDVLNEISRGSEAFSLELFQQLARAVTPDKLDFIISPFSVWSLLVLLAEGANGNTYKQLETILRLPVDLSQIRLVYKYMEQALMINNSAVQLNTNQVLFSDINRPIDIDFQYKLEHVYEADYYPVNFFNTLDAYNQINNYVKEKTGGKINDIVEIGELSEAQMILISAIFFQGRWKYPFNIQETTELPFYDEYNNKVSTVHMMFRHGGCSYIQMPVLQSDILQLSYGNDNRLSMIVILPNKNIPLVTVTDSLRVLGMNYIISELNKGEEDPELEVYLPRFSLTSDFKMNEILQQMGLVDIFSPEKSNLSKISQHLVHVSELVHKSVIQVNEVGTIASAVSGASISYNIASNQFYVNRPFVFLIIERTTNTLLFCGQVRDPAKL